MGSTLDSLRQNSLNEHLGLASDADDRFGSSTVRNHFLQDAWRQLWPQMGRLITEDVTVVANTVDYELEAIRDIERVDILDTDLIAKDRLTSWSLIEDETSDPPQLSLRVPQLVAGLTLHIIGYAPYSVPASGTATSELPVDQEFVVVAGAIMYAYRRRLNEYVDYKQHAADNPLTRIDPATMRDLYLAAKSEFEQLRFDHRRRMTGPRRGRLTTN